MKEFKIIYSRGSGPGGQRKNKVETCVEITHIPTGYKERCQDTPSRARNQKIAMGRLKVRLDARDILEKRERRNLLRIKLMDSAFVVRTYNFQRNEAKDSRTGKKANLKDVLNGKLNLLK